MYYNIFAESVCEQYFMRGCLKMQRTMLLTVLLVVLVVLYSMVCHDVKDHPMTVSPRIWREKLKK